MGVVLSTWASGATAGSIVAPIGATTSMGQFSAAGPQNAINQSGLSIGYSAGDDFDAYLALAPTHNSSTFISNNWASASGNFTGTFDFDLGGAFTVETMALWAHGETQNANLRDFNLYASNSADFSGATLLGSFQQDLANGPLGAVELDLFSFAPTTASFIRMEVLTNHGDPAFVTFGEVIFEGVAASGLAVPGPGTLPVLGLATVLVGFSRIRRSADVS